ncbi:unnamed protein product [Rotaria sordida]|uniref:Mab-21-like nucleotidyltransferase domain-containing protein n=2 Tax=Rotaria sordida TaxID=392033 RepID=A0A815QBL6_9BILA|nr:unnamed protein product [Rotaria sordida]CAF1460903.1 unnamed protein product [Rotaria sordida]CAF4018909.1 unnamed protein product [Rotaria sordida]
MSDDRINETEYLSILLDYCLQRFLTGPTFCHHINTFHFKEVFADALHWTNGFEAKLSGSRLTGLFEQYLVKLKNEYVSVVGGDTDIMFEPQDTFVSDLDIGLSSQIGFLEKTQYPGFYYIEYNPKTKYDSTLRYLDIFEEKNNKQYLSSKKLVDLLHTEFSKYTTHGPLSIELHGPAISATLSDGTTLQDFVFSLPMLKIPYHVREQWSNRSKQWPSGDVVETVSGSICHLVPKRWSETNEGDEDTLTWRLSLSFAEVLLTNSWDRKHKDYYLLLKSFIQELAPDIIQQLSITLKSKTMSNYFIPEIDMLQLIPEEKCLYLAEKLKQLYEKPVQTIRQMHKSFQDFMFWSCVRLPLADDYSKIKIYTWYLRSSLCLALRDSEHLRLQRLEHVVRMSNMYFPSSLSVDNISNAEELLFIWLDIVITSELRENFPNCFEQKQQQEISQYSNKIPIWLRFYSAPIGFVFEVLYMPIDESIDEMVDNEILSMKAAEVGIEEEEDDADSDDAVEIPLLKSNGTATNINDYFYIPILKTRFREIFEFLLKIVCTPLLDLPSCQDLQYLIDRFHSLGIKHELIGNAFYQAALHRCSDICTLKSNIHALEKNDPICVNVPKEEKDIMKRRTDVWCEQMKNLFHAASQLIPAQAWKIHVHMGYTFYFLFGRYDEAIDVMKTNIELYNTNRKLEKPDLSIPTVVLAYYTLLQSFRMTGQWDKGREYIEQFEQTCAELEIHFGGEIDMIVVKILLATGYYCLALLEEATDLLIQLEKMDSDSGDELMSLCGVQCFLLPSNIQYPPDRGLTLELPYALSECGGENEKIYVKPELIKNFPNLLYVRHGHDCYKMQSWLVGSSTILVELEKWMNRVQDINFPLAQQERN